MTRRFPAPRARVFDWFVDPARLVTWWGPRGFSVPRIDFDPRVGASYRIVMQPPGADAFVLAGTFREVEAPSRLSFSFRWEPADADDVETVAQLAFREHDDSTEVRLVHGRFATDERCALHRNGWTASLDRLAELMSR